MTARLVISAEARSLYDETISRGVAREFLFWDWSTESEAEEQILQTFYTAACVDELAEGGAMEEERILDLAEARLAVVALNIAASGDRGIASDEGSVANEYLRATLDRMVLGPVRGYTGAEYLRMQATERAQGWRRISNSFVAREIRGVFSMAALDILDSRDGRNTVETVMAAYALNFYAGGTGDSIRAETAWAASQGLERALGML